MSKPAKAAAPAQTIPIEEHSGSKYLRQIHPAGGDGVPIGVDVYAVLEAFGVACPARQHALKKLLCAGLRGKGGQVEDLTEAVHALYRAIEMQRQREDRQDGV